MFRFKSRNFKQGYVDAFCQTHNSFGWYTATQYDERAYAEVVAEIVHSGNTHNMKLTLTEGAPSDYLDGVYQFYADLWRDVNRSRKRGQITHKFSI